MKLKGTVLIILTTLFVLSCNKEEVAETELEGENANAIVGQWFLTTINDTSVSTIECYNESYIESDGDTITLYILDRLEDGSCETVLDVSGELSVADDFYYIGEEAIEIYIEGSSLTWRVDTETTLVFRKR